MKFVLMAIALMALLVLGVITLSAVFWMQVGVGLHPALAMPAAAFVAVVGYRTSSLIQD